MAWQAASLPQCTFRRGEAHVAGELHGHVAVDRPIAMLLTEHNHGLRTGRLPVGIHARSPAARPSIDRVVEGTTRCDNDAFARYALEALRSHPTEHAGVRDEVDSLASCGLFRLTPRVLQDGVYRWHLRPRGPRQDGAPPRAT